MSRTRKRTPYRRRKALRACWKDCNICYRRLGVTIGTARKALLRKISSRMVDTDT